MKKFNNLVKKILLKENPIFMDKPLPISLNNKETNDEILNKSFQEGEKIDSFEGRDVYRISDHLLYFCFTKNGIADAYVEFSIDDSEINTKRVVQRKSKDSRGFLRRVFLNYFSNIFSSIQLDSVANRHGKDFFKKLISESMAKGFKVTIINRETKEEAPYIEDNFEQYWFGKSNINDKKVEPYNTLFKIYFQ